MPNRIRAHRHLYAFLLLIFSGILSHAQSRLSFDHFRITEGLSQSSVTCIVEDEFNQLWFGTQAGLNRFDGTNFESFTRENSPAILNAYIHDGCIDERNNLWFGTKNGLLTYNYRSGKFTSIQLPNKNQKSIKKLVSVGRNTIFILTSNHKLYRFDTQKRIASIIKINGRIKSFVKVKDGCLVLVDNRKVYFVDLNGKPRLSYQGKEGISSLKSIRKKIFAFTKQGMFQLIIGHNKNKFQKIFGTYEGIDFTNITDLVLLDGVYYISTTQQGLFSVTKNGKWQNYRSNLFQSNQLISNNLNKLYLTKDKVLWIGTDRGVSCTLLSGSGFNTIRPSINLNKGLPSENVWSFGIYGQDILIGTDLGITQFNPITETTRQFMRKNNGITDASVMGIEEISSNHYLVTCFDGLFKFNPGSPDPFVPIPINDPQIKEKHVHFYCIKPFGKSYLIGTSAGLLSLDLLQNRLTEVNPTLQDQVREIKYDAKGRCWVLFENFGLYQVKFNTKSVQLVPFPFNDKLIKSSNDPFTSFVELNASNMLLGTMGSGIREVNKISGAIRVISKAQGLPNNTINSLIKDRKGNVWASTNRGLVCINPQGFLNPDIERRGEELNEYNMNAALDAPNGDIYFGGIFGAVYFNPGAVMNPSFAMYPKITMVTLLKKSNRFPNGFITESQLKSMAYEIELPYKQRDFEVKFQANELYGAKHVTYKYVIIGEETDTILLGKTNRLSFSSLAAGTYFLRLYARYENGPWTDTPALLTVIINPPFWATTPFWIGIAALLLLLTYFYAKYQINRERQQRIKLEDLVAKRTFEIQEQKNQIVRKNELISIEKEKVLEQQKLLFIEKERAEKWLNNALPSQAVKELKVQGKVSAKAYDSATIIFTDVVGFTKISESVTPTRLVNKLDILFRKFDQIIKENNLEKIKTIGDAYMAAGGLPDENSTHAIDACVAGLQIQHYMQAKKFDALANHKDFWEIRLGINSGPVTAGIIGSLKMAYDVWGSAVNQAQRMEMLGQPGAVTISGETFKLVEPYFECVHKGKAQMKSNVLLDMFEVIRIKPELSIKGEGLKPNDLFYEIVGLHYYSSIKYYNAENELIQLLSQELPKELTYHSLDHTKEVVKAVERIALLEGVRDEGLFLLKSAALFHDAGFTKQYEHNEPIGAAMAEQMLPKYGYNEQHIKTIKELIYVTQIPHKPVNKLQEIICDADLDYLGTDAFDEISERLKVELKAKGKIQTDKEWDEIQVSFLKQHRYFTQTAILSRDKKKKEHLKRIKQRLERNEY